MKVAETEISESTLNDTIIQIVKGISIDAIKAGLDRKGLPTQLADECIEQAKVRIKIAATYDKQEQLGLAINQLNQIYTNSVEPDPKTALQARKELSKIMNLYEVSKTQHNDNQEDHSEELDVIRQHLEPLGLAREGYPITELARLAAAEIRNGRESNGNAGIRT